MKRITMLGAAALITLLPSIASARSHVGFFFGIGAGPIGLGFSNFGYHRDYCYAPVYSTYIAPPVYCAPPPVVYSQPQAYYAAPSYPTQTYYSAQVYSTPTYCAPPVVYAAPTYYAPRPYYYYPRAYFGVSSFYYSHRR